MWTVSLGSYEASKTSICTWVNGKEQADFFSWQSPKEIIDKITWYTEISCASHASWEIQHCVDCILKGSASLDCFSCAMNRIYNEENYAL